MTQRAEPATAETSRDEGSRAEGSPAAGSRAEDGRGRWAWPLLVCLVTAAYAAIPILLEPWFYQRGDTAAQFAPTWFHLGELLRDGVWPVWLDHASWAGGNYVAEALFGTYNPLNHLVWLGVSFSPDLVTATFVVKALVLVALALGTYALAREYGALRPAAAAVAVALPFSGFTLFWDAGSWPAGLMAFAYAPWVWVTMRRALRGAGSPFWAFLAALLAVLNGNPYGTLAVVLIGAALIVEGMVTRAWRGVLSLAVVGVAVAAFLPLVYLPLLEAADLAVRSTQGALFENSGKLRPTAGDLLAASSPLHVPPVRAITGPMRVPATYLAWFVLPLLPWLRYGVLRGRAREMTGLVLVTAAYLAITLGPSKLWLFRWPLRVIEYFYLGVLVVVAVLLSAGLARTQVRGRFLASGVVVAVLGWLTWSQDPAALRRAALGTAALAALTVVLLGVHLLLRRTALVAVVAIAGVGAVLAMQVAVFGENESSRVWHVPGDVAELQDRFADREGRTMQFADLKPLQNRGQVAELERQWQVFLPGSMYHPAGVEAVNNYTGMGFLPFTRTFCMEYDGLTKKCGYRNLWRPGGPGQPPLADLMKLDTVVVQPRLAQGVTAGEGWSEQPTSGPGPEVLVLRHEGEHDFEGSELSWVSSGVEVASAETVSDLHQRVQLEPAPSGGRLVFSMLGWPGWEADLDGRALAVGHDQSGLLTVELPEGASGTLDLTYRPPGLALGLAGAAFGGLLGLVLALLGLRSWRRGRRRDGADGRAAGRRRVTSVSGSPPHDQTDQ